MLDIALKLLEEITSCGFQAYIVGGFVRDHILGIDSNDIDINTNATPKEIKDAYKKCIKLMSEEEIFEAHCVGCACGDGYDCNRGNGCNNYEDGTEPLLG